MDKIESLKIGDKLTNQDIVRIFNVANMGGMRKNKKANILVIISDHTKGIYDDKYYGQQLHYTGMGKLGDQKLEKQNKTVAESNINGVKIFLFEVFKPKEYIYQGIVKLEEKPYQEVQKDVEGKNRKVWIFPLSLEKNTFIDLKVYEECLAKKQSLLSKKNKAELYEIIKEKECKKASYRKTVNNTYIRDPYIIEFAKLRANGYCQLCGNEAPFKNPMGEPYLEVHHIVWLSRGGTDTIDNVVALCPNCHRKIHILDKDEDKIYLKKVIKNNNIDIQY